MSLSEYGRVWQRFRFDHHPLEIELCIRNFVMSNLCNTNANSNDFIGVMSFDFLVFAKPSLFCIRAQTMSKADSIAVIFTDRYVVVGLRLFCLSDDASNDREFADASALRLLLAPHSGFQHVV